MSLIPYANGLEQHLRRMEREFFRANNFFGPSPFNQLVALDYLKSPSSLENGFRSMEKFLEPMERISRGMNRFAAKEMKNIKSDKDKFQVNIDVHHFAPDEIKVKVLDGHVVVQAKHEEQEDHHGYISREFVRRYALPQGCLPDTVKSTLSSDGVLTVTAPKVLPMPSIGERIVPIMHN